MPDHYSPVATKVAGYILPFVVYGLIGYTWYVYIFRICTYLLYTSTRVNTTAEAICFIIISSLLWIMTLICYTRILLTPPGKPLTRYDRLPSMEEGYQQPQPQQNTLLLPKYYYSPKGFDFSTMTPNTTSKDDIMPVVSTCRQDGQARYCHMCECYKPERTHHCRDCNACVLKMDHHCPWINGCVGFKNYKFFFLFVLYTAIYSLWGLGSALPIVIQGIQELEADLDPQWLVLVILAFIFGLTLTGFAIVHAFYIINNQTTIEHVADRPVDIRVDFDHTGQNFEVITVPPEDNLYKRSKLENWNNVMGTNVLLWFIPVKRGPGDGTVFPYNNFMFDHIISRATKQRRSMDIPHFNNNNSNINDQHYERERLSSIESTAHMT